MNEDLKLAYNLFKLTLHPDVRDYYTFDKFTQNLLQDPEFVNTIKTRYGKKFGNDLADKLFGKTTEEFYNKYRYKPETNLQDYSAIAGLSLSEFPDEEEKLTDQLNQKQITLKPEEESQFSEGKEYPGFFSDLWNNWLSPVLRGVGETIFETFQVATKPSIQPFVYDLEGNLRESTAFTLAKEYFDVKSKITSPDQLDQMNDYKKQEAYNTALKIQKLYNKMPANEKEELINILKQAGYFDSTINELLNAKRPEDITGQNIIEKLVSTFDTAVLTNIYGYIQSKSRYGEHIGITQEQSKILEKYGVKANDLLNDVYGFYLNKLGTYNSKGEYIADQAWRTLLISFQMLRGLSQVKKATGVRLYSEGSKSFDKLVEKPGNRLLDPTKTSELVNRMELPKKSRYKIVIDKNDNIVGVQTSNKWTLRALQLNEYGKKSIESSIPRIMGEMSKEKIEAEVRGVKIDGSFYTGRLGMKIFEAYTEGIGEYFGTLMSPYVNIFSSKFIKNGFIRGLVNHAIANPIGESIEERVTDIFQQYIPAILQGLSPETIDSLVEKLKMEYITFLPLTATGLGLEYMQKASYKRQVEEIKRQFEKVAKKQTEISELKEKEEVKNKLFDELIEKLSNIRDQLTDEEKQKFDNYINSGKNEIINFFASGEFGEEAKKIYDDFVAKTAENEKELEIRFTDSLNKLNEITNAAKSKIKSKPIQKLFDDVEEMLSVEEIDNNTIELLNKKFEEISKSASKLSNVNKLAFEEYKKQLKEFIVNKQAYDNAKKVNFYDTKLKEEANKKIDKFIRSLADLLPEDKKEELNSLKDEELEKIFILASINNEKVNAYIYEKLNAKIDQIADKYYDTYQEKQYQQFDKKYIRIYEKSVKNIFNSVLYFAKQLGNTNLLKNAIKLESELNKLDSLDELEKYSKLIDIEKQLNENYDIIKKEYENLRSKKDLSEQQKAILQDKNIKSITEQYKKAIEKIDEINLKRVKFTQKFKDHKELNKKLFKLKLAEALPEKTDIKNDFIVNIVSEINNSIKDIDTDIASVMPYVDEFFSVKNRIQDKLYSKKLEEDKYEELLGKIVKLENHNPNTNPIVNNKRWTKRFQQAFNLIDNEEEGKYLFPNDKVGIKYRVKLEYLPLLIRYFKDKLGYTDYEYQFLNDNVAEFTLYVGSYDNTSKVRNTLRKWGILGSSQIVKRADEIKAFIEQLEENRKAKKEELKSYIEKHKEELDEKTIKELEQKKTIEEEISEDLYKEIQIYWEGSNKAERDKIKEEIAKIDKKSIKEKKIELEKLNAAIKEYKKTHKLNTLQTKALNNLQYNIIRILKSKKSEEKIEGKKIYELQKNYEKIKQEKTEKIELKETVKQTKKEPRSLNEVIQKSYIIEDKINEVKTQTFIKRYLYKKKTNNEDKDKTLSEIALKQFAELTEAEQEKVIKVFKDKQKEGENYLITTDILEKVLEILHTKKEVKSKIEEKTKEKTSSQIKSGEKPKLPSLQEFIKKIEEKKQETKQETKQEIKQETEQKAEQEAKKQKLPPFEEFIKQFEGTSKETKQEKQNKLPSLEEVIKRAKSNFTKMMEPPQYSESDEKISVNILFEKVFGNKFYLTLKEFFEIIEPITDFDKVVKDNADVLTPETIVFDAGKLIDRVRNNDLKLLFKHYLQHTYAVALPKSSLSDQYIAAAMYNAKNQIERYRNQLNNTNNYRERVKIERIIYDLESNFLLWKLISITANQFTLEQLQHGMIIINTAATASKSITPQDIIYHEGLHMLLHETFDNPDNFSLVSDLYDLAVKMFNMMKEYYKGEVPPEFTNIFGSTTDITHDQLLVLHELYAYMFTNLHKPTKFWLDAMAPDGSNKSVFRRFVEKIINYILELVKLDRFKINTAYDVFINGFEEMMLRQKILRSTIDNTPGIYLMSAANKEENLEEKILNYVNNNLKEVEEKFNVILDTLESGKDYDSFLKWAENVINTYDNYGDVYIINAIYSIVNDLDSNTLHIIDINYEMIMNSLIRYVDVVKRKVDTELNNKAKINNINNNSTEESNHNREINEDRIIPDSELDIDKMIPVEDDISKSVMSEYDDIINESILFAKELGVLIARVYKEPGFANIFEYVKANNISFKQFLSYFNSNTAEGRYIVGKLKEIWESKYKNKMSDFDNWKLLSLTRIYNQIISKDSYPHIRIKIIRKDLNNPDNIELKMDTNVGLQFTDSDGNKITTLVGKSVILDYVELLSTIFGNLSVAYIGEIVEQIGRNSRSIDYNKSVLKDSFQLAAKFLYENGYIFLGRFADKNTMPIIKFDKKEIENSKEIIEKILKRYKKLSGNNNPLGDYPNSVVLFFNLMFYEFSLGSNLGKILSGKFEIKDSKILQKTVEVKDGNPKEKPNALFKILKRVPFILPKRLGNAESVIDRFNITDKADNATVSGIHYKIINGRKKLFINHVTIATESLDENTTIQLDGQSYNLRELLFNIFGTEITDGLSIAVETNNGKSFFDLYNYYYGEVKRGTIKQFTFRLAPNDSMYLKHSIQRISAEDIIGKWMVKNNITVLSFESANKLSNNKLSTLLSDNPIIDEVDFDEMSHDYIKGEIQSKVKAIKQMITASYLSRNNKILSKNVTLIKLFKTLINNNHKLKTKFIADQLEPAEVYKYLMKIIKSPANYYESKLSKSLDVIKDITLEEFKDSYYELIKYPPFTEAIESLILEQLEGMFSGEMKKGSALTLIADLGILADGRLKEIKRQIENYNRLNPGNQINSNDVFNEQGRLKEGYAVVSSNFAKEKNVEVGDDIIHTLVPSDSLLAINTSKVVAILPERLFDPGGLMLNSEYAQTIIGRDYDIDVLYTFVYDKNIFSIENWQQLVEAVKVTQKDIRKKYVEIVKEVYSWNINIKKAIAEELGIPFEKFEITDISIAFNKIVQKGFMQILYGTADLSSLSMFDQSLITAKNLFHKDIGKEVHQRNLYTLLLSIGFKTTIQLESGITITLDPANSEQPINDIKHIIQTNDRVDAPNRENIFYYNYNENFDFLMDMIGYSKAKEIIEQNLITEAEIIAIKTAVNTLFENYIVVTKDYEINNKIERNINSYLRRVLKQKEVNQALENKNITLIKQLVKDIYSSKYQYRADSIFKLSSKKQEFLNQQLLPMIEKIFEGLDIKSLKMSDNAIMNLINNFNMLDVPSIAISRKHYIEIENKIRNKILSIVAPTIANKFSLPMFRYEPKNILTTLISYDVERFRNGKYKHINEDKNKIGAHNIFKHWSLSRVYAGMQAIITIQSELVPDKQLAEITPYMQGRNDVYPYFFREVMYHEKVFLLQENSQEVKLGKFRNKDILVKAQDGELYFKAGVSNFISRKKITGIEKYTKEEEVLVNFLRQALFGQEAVIKNPDVRIQMDKLFTMLSVVKMDGYVPANVLTRDRVKIMVDYLNNAFNTQYNGENIFSNEDKELLLAFLLGNYENVLDTGKPMNFFQTNIGNIEDKERYEEIKKGESRFETVDYGTNIDSLIIINQVMPEFAKMYLREFTNYLKLKNMDSTTAQNTVNPMSSNFHFMKSVKQQVKGFVEYNLEKYSSLRNPKPLMMMRFIKELIVSPERAYTFLKEYIKDLVLLEAIRKYDAENISTMIKEIKTLSINQFFEKYKDMDLIFDKTEYLNVRLSEFGLKVDEKENILGSRIRRKLFLTFLSINNIRDSYLSELRGTPGFLRRMFMNMERYAVDNQLRVYTQDRESVIDAFPMFNVNIDKYSEKIYKVKHLQLVQLEYLNPTDFKAPGLLDEIQYRTFFLNGELRKMQYQLQLRLNNIGNLLRVAKGELKNNPYFVFDGHFEEYFKMRVYDMAEKGMKINNMVLFKENNKYYIKIGNKIYTTSEQEKDYQNILDAFYPLPQIDYSLNQNSEEFKEQVRKYKEAQFERYVLQSAIEARILFDFEVKNILYQFVTYLSDLKEIAAKTGNTDLLKKTEKIERTYYEFIISFGHRTGTYLPRYWNKAVYMEMYKQHNYSDIRDRLIKNNPDLSQEELDKLIEKEVQRELSFIVENGFGISFNPNARMRTLPDYYTGYEKDIFFSINSYIKNFYDMLHDDLMRAEWIRFQIKSREYKENPAIHDTVRMYYNNQIKHKDTAGKQIDYNEIKKGYEIEFMYYDEEALEEKVVAGVVKDINKVNGKIESIILMNGAGEEKSYNIDNIYIYNSFGEIEGRVTKFQSQGWIEYLRELERMYAYTNQKYKEKLIRLIEIPLTKFFNSANYITTMSILGTLGQFAAVTTNFLGGKALNLIDAPIRNFLYERRLKDFKRSKEDVLNDMMIRMGLETPEFLMDNASYTDISINRIGIDESFWSTVRTMISEIYQKLTKANIAGSKDLELYKEEILELRRKYYENPSKLVRKQILDKTIDYTTRKYELNLITTQDYKERIDYYNYIYQYFAKSLPIDKEIFKDINIKAELKSLKEYLKNKFDSSYLGMKLFVSVEKSLRLQAMIIGYYQARAVLNDTDERLQLESGMIYSWKKQKFYGAADRQFASNTTIGKLLFKFAHFAYDEFIRAQKQLVSAFKSSFLYGIKPVNTIFDKIISDKGYIEKKAVANNTAYFYMKTMLIIYFINSIAELFTGIDNVLNPYKNFQIKLFKYITKLLAEKYKTGNKLKREDIDLLRSFMQGIGLGYGHTLIPNLIMYENTYSSERGRFPLIPRAYWVGKSIYNFMNSEYNEFDNLYKTKSTSLYKLSNLERSLTGMNIFMNPVSDKQKIKNMVFPDKIRELSKKPVDFFPEITNISRVFRNSIKNETISTPLL